MSICIAIIPPKKSIEAIAHALGAYHEYAAKIAPEHVWHIPLLTVNSVPSNEALRQSFHQTLRILSIGEGEEAGQLWVRIQNTPALTALREDLIQKTGVRDAPPFVPHIYLGSFEKVPSFGVIDTPLGITFSIRELHIVQTLPYEILGTIPLTP